MTPPKIDNKTWRLLFQMGDRLLLQSSIFDQVQILKKELKKLSGAEIDIILLGRFKPLPSQADEIKQEHENKLQFADSFKEIFDIKKQNWKSEVLEIPLEKDGLILGKIILDYGQPVDVSDDFYQFLKIAGRYFAGLLDMTRQSVLKEWRFEQLSLVRSVSFEIVRYRDTRQLFNKIVQLIQNTFKFYFVALYTMDDSQQILNFQASAGKELLPKQLEALNLGSGIPLGKGLVGKCAGTAEEVLSQDVQLDNNYRIVDGLDEARSEICLPLRNNDQSLGVLEILSDQPHVFHENDVMVLRILADSVALAIENSGLFKDLLEKTWISTTMLQVAEAAQAYDNVQDLFTALVRILPLLAGVDRCAIYQHGKSTDEFILNAHHGFEKNLEPKLAMLPYEKKAAKIFQKLMILKIPLDLDRALLEDSELDEQDGNKCCKLIPIAAHDQVFGVLLVDQEKQLISDGDSGMAQLDILLSIARQIALAIDNFELKESREHEAYITAVLLQVAEMVAVSKSLDETLSNIINLLPLVVGIDTALVYLFDDQHNRMHLRSSYSQSWKKQINSLGKSVKTGTNGSLVFAVNQKHPCYCHIGDVSPENWLKVDYIPFVQQDEIPANPEPALVLFPLFIQEEFLGLLMVMESDQGVELREKKGEIIKGVAQQLSVAIQNERLKSEMVDRERMKREFQLAQDIQKTFLPEKLPSIQDWDISVRWRPALQVGGDFYDVIPIFENRYVLVVADVSDKGLPAALYMTVARTLIHAVALEGNSPVDTLQQVNHLLLENSKEGLFITVFLAILDTETGELVYANAGHNKPLLVRKNRNNVVWLDKGGMPLGVADSLQLENKTLQIRPEDYLVMYTDGVTEARSPDDVLFGEDRLFHLVKNYKLNSGEDLIEVIDSRIIDFQANAPASDDVTLFVVHRD